jgi:HTH-type transcriptional regulator/antitoxin HigA
MTALKYKVIKSKRQYHEYSDIRKELLSAGVKTKALQEEIELLAVLIEKWDNDHSFEENSFEDPVALVRALMEQRNLKAKDLVEILGVSKGLVSGILNRKKGLSKENIRTLEEYFKVDIALRYSYRS